MMNTIWLLLMVGVGVALLAWSRRMTPMRSSQDGTRFECRISDPLNQTIHRRGRTAWSEGRCEVIGDRVLVLAGPFAKTFYGDPLPIVARSPLPPAGLSVYVASEGSTHVVIGVERGSPADRRLGQLLDR